MPYMDTFRALHPLLVNTQLVQDHQQTQIMSIIICLKIYGTHMNELFNLKVEILVPSKWILYAPTIMLTIELGIVGIF